MNSSLYAALLLHDSGSGAGTCVASLQAWLPPERILVGDNGSPDHAAWRPPAGIETVRFGENLGYCGGMNRLFSMVQDRGGRYVLALNPNTTIDEGSVERLWQAIQDNAVGIAYPRVVESGQPTRLIADGGDIMFRHMAVRYPGAGALVPDCPGCVGVAIARDVPCGHGACYLIRLEACVDVGGFDEALFAYHDEADLCLRMRSRGWRTVQVSSAVARHRSQATTGPKLRMRAYLAARNSVMLVRRHGGMWDRLRFAVFLAAGAAWYAARATAGNEWAGPALRGWWDGLRGRTGKPVAR